MLLQTIQLQSEMISLKFTHLIKPLIITKIVKSVIGQIRTKLKTADFLVYQILTKATAMFVST